MFDFLRRKKHKDGDPLSSLKTATKWMQDLPTGDLYSAQESLVKELVRFNRTESALTKERLHVLMMLDEKNRDMHATLRSEYLRNPRMSRSMESKLWTMIHAYYWEITRGYHSFIMDFVANPGGSKYQSLVPQITARGLRGFADIIKWRYFRYESIEDKLWLRLHNLYRIAEFDGFADQRIQIYKTDTDKHSCVHEYGQALLLSLLANGSLLPRQLEILDDILDSWSPMIQVDVRFLPGRHTFYVDTMAGIGLRRIRSELNSNGIRYVPTDKLLAHIQTVKQSLKNGDSPIQLGLGEDFRLPEGFTLLDYASNQWSPVSERERRVEDRQEGSGKWQILHDVVPIWSELDVDNTLAKTGSASSLTPEEELDIRLYGFVTEKTRSMARPNATQLRCDVWEQLDSSSTGIGFLIGQKEYPWLRVGRLVSMRPNPETPWKVGIVRRIVRNDEGNRIVGISYYDADAEAVALEPDRSFNELSFADDGYLVNEYDPTPGNGQVHRGILLKSLDSGDEHLLLESAHYKHGQVYQIRRRDDSTVLVTLDAVIDKGDTWVKSGLIPQ